MAKYNRPHLRPAVHSPVHTEATPSGRTFEGAPGYARDVRSELFLLAVSNFGSEKTFYEAGQTRDERYVNLVRQAAVEHPEWAAGLLRWLRGDANMRTAALIGAAEFVHARLALGITRDWIDSNPGINRRVIDAVCQRADEPGELLAYWRATHGRRTPMPIKRGLGDAVARLYNERSYLKWDSEARGIRMADVIELCHPTARAPWQDALFSRMLDVRHGRGAESADPDTLPMLARRQGFGEFVAARPEILLDPNELARAGLTWEAALSMAGTTVDKAKLWEALIPSMGYMALLRNLRNFDQAGVSDAVARDVAERLADPDQVARSRQLPMRFLSAYRAAPSLRWSWPLEQALDHSLAGVPTLGGRTLILVDTSSSMDDTFSKDGTLKRWDAATVFGLALARRCATVDVVSFSATQRYWGDARGGRTKVFTGQPGESLLRAVERWRSGGYFLGGGTETELALREQFAGHDRVVILTDEQASRQDVGHLLPATPIYTWNLAGYRFGHAPGGGHRHTFGGLSDQSFQMIALLEAARDAAWPWEQNPTD